MSKLPSEYPGEQHGRRRVHAQKYNKTKSVNRFQYEKLQNDERQNCGRKTLCMIFKICVVNLFLKPALKIKT